MATYVMSATMWAYQLVGPFRFVRHDVDVPPFEYLADGDVVLRFLAGGICGSDVARYKRFSGDPAPIGGYLHEIVGEVVASRSELEVGARVVGWARDSRGLCEYVTTSATDVIPVAEQYDDACAVAVQPLACVLYALSRICEVAGRRSAVIGLGPIGLLFTHALNDAGAASVHGVDEVARARIASTFGLDRVMHESSQSWARAAENRDSFDLIVEAVGHQFGTVDDAISAAAPGGHVLCFGNPDDTRYPVPFGTLMNKNLTVYAGRTPADQRRAALRRAQDYLARYPDLAQAYVTQVRPVEQVQTAAEMASRPSADQIKIVLTRSA